MLGTGCWSSGFDIALVDVEQEYERHGSKSRLFMTAFRARAGVLGVSSVYIAYVYIACNTDEKWIYLVQMTVTANAPESLFMRYYSVDLSMMQCWILPRFSQ